MRSQRSGQIRIIEAFLAVLIIFSSFTISTNFAPTQNITRHDDLASMGLQALIKLDFSGSLGNYIVDGNWSALRDALNLALPAGVCFNLTVYDDYMQQVNTAVVSNGGLSSHQIAFVEYVCAGQDNVFRCYIIHLHLAVAT